MPTRVWKVTVWVQKYFSRLNRIADTNQINSRSVSGQRSQGKVTLTCILTMLHVFSWPLTLVGSWAWRAWDKISHLRICDIFFCRTPPPWEVTFLHISILTQHYARPPPREGYNYYTRQMMIIAGGEPELCCRRHAKREGGVYVLSRMQCARVVLM